MSKGNSEVRNGKSLISFIDPIRVIGDSKIVLTGAMSIYSAKSQHLSFCNKHGNLGAKTIEKSRAGMIICFDDVTEAEKLADRRCLVTVRNPRLTFIRCLNHFFKEEIVWGVDPTALIDADVSLPGNVKIGRGAYIGRGASIGEGTVIEGRVHVGNGCKIGRNVYIQVGAVIGCEGQAFERNEEGELEKFPQSGSVIIEDNVEIGANSTVVGGTFHDTIIGRGSKIGHLTDIGHNVRIGKHVFISACVVIGGSSIIGDFSWLAPGAIVRDGVTVGDNVKVGLGTVVTKSVESNENLMGNPAQNLKDYVRTFRWMEKGAKGGVK